nr:MAG TPA: hypothetical protein [Caudoviricetes sp.]
MARAAPRCGGSSIPRTFTMSDERGRFMSDDVTNDLVSDGESYTGADEPRGYPRDTPVKDMKPEEAAAFWKHHAYLERKARAADEKTAQQKIEELTAKIAEQSDEQVADSSEKEHTEAEPEEPAEPKGSEKKEKSDAGATGDEAGKAGGQADGKADEPVEGGQAEPQTDPRVTKYLVTTGLRASGLKKEDVDRLGGYLRFDAFLGADGLPDDGKLEAFVKLVSVEQPSKSATMAPTGFPDQTDHANDVAYWMRKLKES